MTSRNMSVRYDYEGQGFELTHLSPINEKIQRVRLHVRSCAVEKLDHPAIRGTLYFNELKDLEQHVEVYYPKNAPRTPQPTQVSSGISTARTWSTSCWTPATPWDSPSTPPPSRCWSKSTPSSKLNSTAVLEMYPCINIGESKECEGVGGRGRQRWRSGSGVGAERHESAAGGAGRSILSVRVAARPGRGVSEAAAPFGVPGRTRGRIGIPGANVRLLRPRFTHPLIFNSEKGLRPRDFRSHIADPLSVQVRAQAQDYFRSAAWGGR